MATNVRGTVRFLADLPLYGTEKPYRLLLPAGIENGNIKTHNLVYEETEISCIRDLRGHEAEFDIDSAGFEVVQHCSGFTTAATGQELLDGYKRETEQFLLRHFGASYVYCWDALVRKRKQAVREQFNIRDRLVENIPVYHAHNDETFSRGWESLSFRLGEDRYRRFLESGCRIRMVNTWRSLVDSLEDNPLTLCDWRSIDPRKDLIESDQIVPSRETEIYHIFARPHHRWHWLSRQRRDEVYIFLQFDTRADGNARCR
ncbi:hypothetical protein G647_09205 [Cladophialophora carrionii CBS 160.54]|uniref:Uncharacterized protein n=1 Tax=Cladophialophora carrionii CBS 160.54 TaxID=1279043 RepID=V9CZD9_9EURO|nr:uncharacterized protein G647_09205 [Cladophialophora carrionii CBS 160.54]ETI19373.1 hypothetical protein G647_09205 [Cladophialophora carrionii CBS 160.54]